MRTTQKKKKKRVGTIRSRVRFFHFTYLGEQTASRKLVNKTQYHIIVLIIFPRGDITKIIHVIILNTRESTPYHETFHIQENGGFFLVNGGDTAQTVWGSLSVSPNI